MFCTAESVEPIAIGIAESSRMGPHNGAGYWTMIDVSSKVVDSGILSLHLSGVECHKTLLSLLVDYRSAVHIR